MKTYILTSVKFDGQVIFHFDMDGYLTSFDLNEADLNTEQKVFILNKLPRHIEEVKRVLGHSRDAKLELQRKTKVTFEMFWDKYNEKTRSSKKRSRTKWKRMSQAQRDRAYNFITKYERNIPYGVAKKYAETYLNAELWEN